MIDVNEVGATPRRTPADRWEVSFGIHLPGITWDKGYRLKVRVIHEHDQFTRAVEPKDFWMRWENGSALDRWAATVPLAADPLAAAAGSAFGSEGTYLYRYQLLRGEEPITLWFADPFARRSGLGTLSAFTVDGAAQPFAWTDGAFVVPEVDELVVYELNVREFNRDFHGVIRQLDYLRELGVNALELMPVTNVKEDVEWGYTPLGYFAPDERLGGPDGLRALVDACHARGIAVIVDAVYAHAHPEFAYNLVYESSGEPNPMMGAFADEFFHRPGMDYRRAFTRDYFDAVNRFWLEAFHVDGFRYDYVPGMYDGPMGDGYAGLCYRTYRHSTGYARFQRGNGRSAIIQCAEHLPDPVGILSRTYSSCCWQNRLLDQARALAAGGGSVESFAHTLDPELLGYPTEYRNPSGGDAFPVAPFQYVESHDHRRMINAFGERGVRDLVGEAYGDRGRYYKLQPLAIALYTGKGIPMLWQGQELAENWGVPDWGIARNLFERPVHWEYFYDEAGKALVRLHRILGGLRRRLRALRSRGYFHYFARPEHQQRGVVVFRREAPAAGGLAAEQVIVALNFSDRPQEVWVPFPSAGTWAEQIDGTAPAVQVSQAGEWRPVTVPSNYGAIWLRG